MPAPHQHTPQQNPPTHGFPPHVGVALARDLMHFRVGRSVRCDNNSQLKSSKHSIPLSSGLAAANLSKRLLDKDRRNRYHKTLLTTNRLAPPSLLTSDLLQKQVFKRSALLEGLCGICLCMYGGAVLGFPLKRLERHSFDVFPPASLLLPCEITEITVYLVAI